MLLNDLVSWTQRISNENDVDIIIGEQIEVSNKLEEWNPIYLIYGPSLVLIDILLTPFKSLGPNDRP